MRLDETGRVQGGTARDIKQDPQETLAHLVHCSVIRNSRDTEATQGFVGR